MPYNGSAFIKILNVGLWPTVKDMEFIDIEEPPDACLKCGKVDKITVLSFLNKAMLLY